MFRASPSRALCFAFGRSVAPVFLLVLISQLFFLYHVVGPFVYSFVCLFFRSFVCFGRLKSICVLDFSGRLMSGLFRCFVLSRGGGELRVAPGQILSVSHLRLDGHQARASVPVADVSRVALDVCPRCGAFGSPVSCTPRVDDV